MSDRSTRATPPNPDPRIQFTLSKEDAQALYSAATDPVDDATALDNRLNAWWLEAGQRLGFVWTTVADLVWSYDPDIATRTQPPAVHGATFTAWPSAAAEPDYTDALAWLANSDGEPSTSADLYNRSQVLRAFNAGTDHGFAMGVAVVPDPGLGWDGMELVRESAELLRGYERSHVTKAEGLRHKAGFAEPMKRTNLLEDACDSDEKAVVNADHAQRLEDFLADPAQSHLVHDGLREAREDAANGVVAGWTAALSAVRNLVDDMQKNTGPSALPPLVLLSRIDSLEAPEDMDELLGPWRGVGEQLLALRVARALPIPVRIATDAENLRWALSAIAAYREWSAKASWLDDVMKDETLPRSMRTKFLGKHRADIMRELVLYFMKAAKDLLDDRMVGLRVQAAADVLRANVWGLDQQAKDRIVIAATFLDAAAGEGLSIGDLDAMDVVTELHELLVLDPEHAFHEDVARFLSGKLLGTVPENPELNAHLHGDVGAETPEELMRWADQERGVIPRAAADGFERDAHQVRRPIAEGLECDGKPEGEA
jgi:hypothetical protein